MVGRSLGRRGHSLHHVSGQHLLFDRQAEGGVQEHMVFADGIVAQSLCQFLGHILLQLYCGKLTQQHIAQGRLDVVFDDFLVAIGGGNCPVGPNHVVQPVVQPDAQCGACGQDLAPDAFFPQEGIPHDLGLFQRREAFGLSDPVSRSVNSAADGDVVALFDIVIGDVGSNCFSCHKCTSFLTRI